MELELNKISRTLEEIPDEAGCYIFKSRGKPLYVGKAKSLRKRLAQYLGGKIKGDPKTAAMLERATAVELILTANEAEALLLEMNLIRRLNPPYNVSIRGFPYIKVTKETYPLITVTREVPDEKVARFIGPFTDAGAIRRTVALTNRAFRLRTCRYDLDRRPPKRACLDYEMARCVGPCVNAVTPEEYNRWVEQALKFMTGRRAAVMNELEKKMRQSAAALAFEEAARWRDVVRGLRRAAAGQAAVVTARTDADAVACTVTDGKLYAVILRVREGHLIDRVAFKVNAPIGDPVEEFLLGHYASGGEIPPRLLVWPSFETAATFAETLTKIRGSRVTVDSPRRGNGARLLTLAKKNLEYFIFNEKSKVNVRTVWPSIRESLVKSLGLKNPPQRVEMLDVSHTATREVVGSVVVANDGALVKSEYRRYRIKTARGGDDLGALAEIINRRAARVRANDEKWPDLIVVDGGLAQLAAAREAATTAWDDRVPVIAFAKDPDRVFAFGSSEPVVVDKPALDFLARLRDEAHRFAITYHRRLRASRAAKSLLDDIPGVGPKRRRALIKHFGSIEKIATATPDELASAPTMNRRVADAVYEFFKKGETAR